MNITEILGIQKIQRLGNIQHLQSTSETELFNLIKYKKINTTNIPNIIIYTSETSEQIKAKMSSKTWYNVTTYDDTSFDCTETPCLIDTMLTYKDYTSHLTEEYELIVAIEYLTCNTNPVSDVECILTLRIDITNDIFDQIVPSAIIQDASFTLPKYSTCDTYCQNFESTGCTSTNMVNGLTTFFSPYSAEQISMTNTTSTLNIYKNSNIIQSDVVFDLTTNKKQIFDENKLCVELISIDTVSPINKTYFTFKYNSPKQLFDLTVPIIVGVTIIGYLLLRKK